MERRISILTLCITAAFALSVVPAKRVSAERDLSRYCVGTAPMRVIAIEVNEKSFTPGYVRVTQGECVELTIRANSGVSHNLAIEETDITSEGAPLVSREGRHIGRAVSRANMSCPGCGLLPEGGFAAGENVQLKFQVYMPGLYQLRCKEGMRMTIEARPSSTF